MQDREEEHLRERGMVKEESGETERYRMEEQSRMEHKRALSSRDWRTIQAFLCSHPEWLNRVSSINQPKRRIREEEEEEKSSPERDAFSK